MCRLFGAISAAKMDAQNFLYTSRNRCCVKATSIARRKQGDGWGIGYFDHGQPKIIKSPRAMYRDRQAVRRAAITPRETRSLDMCGGPPIRSN